MGVLSSTSSTQGPCSIRKVNLQSSVETSGKDKILASGPFQEQQAVLRWRGVVDRAGAGMAVNNMSQTSHIKYPRELKEVKAELGSAVSGRVMDP